MEVVLGGNILKEKVGIKDFCLLRIAFVRFLRLKAQKIDYGIFEQMINTVQRLFCLVHYIWDTKKKMKENLMEKRRK